MGDYWKGVNERLYGSTGELYGSRVTGKPPIHSKYKMRQQFAGSEDDLDRLQDAEQTAPWRAPTRPLTKERFSGSLGNLDAPEDFEKQFSTIPRNSSRHRTPESTEETRRLYRDEEPISPATQNLQKQSYDSSPRWQTSHSVEEPTLLSRQKALPESREPHRAQHTEQPSFISGRRKYERLYSSTAELYRAQHAEQQPNSIAGRKADERLHRSTEEISRPSHIGQEQRATSRPNLQDWLYGKREDLPRDTEAQTPSYTSIQTHNRKSGQGPVITSTQRALDPAHRPSDFQIPQSVEDHSFTRERPGRPSVTQHDQQGRRNHSVVDVHVARPVYISDSPASSPRPDDGALLPVHQEEAPKAVLTARPALVLDDKGGRPRLDDYSARPRLDDNGGRPRLDDYGGRPRLDDNGGRPRLDDNGGRPRLDDYGGRPRLDDNGGRPRHDDNGGRPRLDDNGGRPRLDDKGGRPRLDDKGGRPRLDDNGGRSRLDDKGGRPRLDDKGGRPRLDDNGGRPRLDDYSARPRLDDKGGRPRLDDKGGRPRLDDYGARPRPLGAHREDGMKGRAAREAVQEGGVQRSVSSSLRSEVTRIIEAKQQIQASLIRSQDELKQQLRDLKSRMEDQERQWAEERANKEGVILSQKVQIDRMARELKELGTLPHPSHLEDALRKQIKDLTMTMEDQERQWAEERASKEGVILSQKVQIDRMARELKDSGYRSHPSNVEAKLKEQMQALEERLRREQHLHKQMLTSLEAETSSLKLQLEQKNQEMKQRRPNASSFTPPAKASALGLPNLGNTSYINSVIQCLFNIHNLRLYFIQEEYKKDLNRGSPQRGQVAMSLAEVFRAIESGTRTHDAMSNFKRVVEIHEKVFQLQSHPRAHDLLSCLLTWLHNDLTKRQSRRQQQMQPVYDGRDGEGSSVISCLFHGLMESVIYCPRKERIVSRATELFDTLSLAVHGDQESSLQELLNDHFQPRQVDDWGCQHCRRPHRCVHDQKLLSLPQILAIHFYRYTGDTNSSLPTANKTHVMFPPDSLSLQQYTVHRDMECPTYELVSVCSDKGTTTTSQYTAFCRDKSSNRWWVWNDMDLRVTKTDHLQTERDARVVFYTSLMAPSVTQ